MILYNGRPALGQTAYYAPYPYIAPPQESPPYRMPAPGPSGPPPGPGEPGGPILTPQELERQLREEPGAGYPGITVGPQAARPAAPSGAAPSSAAGPGFPVVPAVIAGVAAIVVAFTA